jgi:hypothetical protein
MHDSLLNFHSVFFETPCIKRTSLFRAKTLRLRIVGKLVSNLFSCSCTSFTPQLSAVVTTCIVVFLRSVYTCKFFRQFLLRWIINVQMKVHIHNSSTRSHPSEDENRARNRSKNCKCKWIINRWQSNWRQFQKRVHYICLKSDVHVLCTFVTFRSSQAKKKMQ